MAGKSTFAFIATVIVSLSLLSAASAWHATFPESLIQRSNILVSRSDIAQDLSAHNAVRQQHGAANLTWSNTLASAAQQWANGCVFKHSDGSLGPYGENIAAGTASNFDIVAGIDLWVAEATDYDPSNPQPSHFTQVVWKATTQVGCAIQKCNPVADWGYDGNFIVCEYSPEGNVIGEFSENVQA